MLSCIRPHPSSSLAAAVRLSRAAEHCLAVARGPTRDLEDRTRPRMRTEPRFRPPGLSPGGI